MLACLDVPYVDTHAAELVWLLDHPVLPALASAVATEPPPGAAVELRVLGASHQVVLRRNGVTLTETVACLPGHDPYLPTAVERDVDGQLYRFQAQIDHVTDDDLHEQAQALRRMANRAGGGTAALAAAFPSSPDAVTALRIESGGPAGVAWDTWHVYPNGGQVVTTRTEVR